MSELKQSVQCDQFRSKKCDGKLKTGKTCGCALPHVRGFWCDDDCLIDKRIIHTKCEQNERDMAIKPRTEKQIEAGRRLGLLRSTACRNAEVQE
jgi:hypothetical protein